jgi:hypothetical protein
MMICIFAWPFILKKDYKIRYSGHLKDIDLTIDELNKEEACTRETLSSE